jgi:hypothetical protein
VSKFVLAFLSVGFLAATACADDGSGMGTGISNTKYPDACLTEIASRQAAEMAPVVTYFDAIDVAIVNLLPDTAKAQALKVVSDLDATRAKVLDFEKRWSDFQANRTDGDQDKLQALLDEANALGSELNKELAAGDKVFLNVEHLALNGFRQLVADNLKIGTVIDWDNPPALIYASLLHGDPTAQTGGYVYLGSARPHFLGGGNSTFVVGLNGGQAVGMTAERYYALQISMCRESDKGKVETASVSADILAYLESL